MTETSPLRLRFDEFELDEADALLTCAGEPIALTPKAFAVLCALLRRSGQLVTKTALLDAVWGHQFVSESVLKTTISELRTALGDDAKQPRLIATAARRGYRFIGRTTPNSANPATAAAVSPASAQNAILAPIIGRQAAVQRLLESWALACTGRRQICCVAGEAGIGKTTLIDRFVADLGPIATARGHCVEQFGAGEPYLSVLEALGAMCRADATLLPLLRSVAPTWLLQLPWLLSQDERGQLRTNLTGTRQERMLREFAELIEHYAADRPLLLITEDVHWSDDATVRLLDYVARRRAPARLMWIASYRVADLVSDDHPLNRVRHELRARRLCDEILLDPFSEEELAAYLNRRFPGVRFEESFVRDVHDRTSGLPLFVVNIVDGLKPPSPAGIGPPSPGQPAFDSDWTVPDSLAGAIERQVVRLAPDAIAVLEAASVCGAEFRIAAVADATGRDTQAVASCCAELARSGVWIQGLAVDRLPDGALDARYVFRHALYRHVFYRRIAEIERARLHCRIAGSLEARLGAAASAAELAWHFERGLEPMAALACYARAADAALGRYAPTEAAALAARGLALLERGPDTTERLERELALVHRFGVAHSQLSGIVSDEARASFRRAATICELLPPSASRAWMLVGLGWLLVIRGEYADTCSLAARAHALGERDGDRVLQGATAGLLASAQSIQGQLVEAHQWAEAGIAFCDGHSELRRHTATIVDPEAAARAIVAFTAPYLGMFDATEEYVQSALARADAVGHAMTRVFTLRYVAFAQAQLQNAERVLEYAMALAELVAKHRLGVIEGSVKWLQGWAEARLGRAAAGHKLVLEGFTQYRRAGPECACSLILCHAAEAALLNADPDAAERHVADGLTFATRLGENLFVPDLLMCRARAEHATGRADAARKTLGDAARSAEAMQALTTELAVRSARCCLDDSAASCEVQALGTLLARVPATVRAPVVTRARELVARR